MSEIIRVIDLSEFTGPVAHKNARCMFEKGIRAVIIQAWGGGHIPGRRNEYFHQAVDAFRAAGITKIDPYVWPPREWREALDWIGDYKRFMSGAVYLDVEAGAGVNDSMVVGVREAGWEPRIYASPSSWRTIMGNTDRYADLKLWLARYLNRFRRPDGFYEAGFDVSFPRDVFGVSRVGGWELADVVGWQITGTVPNFCDESVDCSLFYARAFKREEDDMVDQALRNVVSDLKRIVTEQGERLDQQDERLLAIEINSDIDDAVADAGAVQEIALAEHSADPDAHHE